MNQRNLQQDLITLGISVNEINVIVARNYDNLDVWENRTKEFHELVRNARKHQLKKWHPDVCKESNATIKAAEINAAADGLLSVKFRPPQPQPIFQMIIISPEWRTPTSNSTIDWNSGTGGWG
jgi:hypothetical protein